MIITIVLKNTKNTTIRATTLYYFIIHSYFIAIVYIFILLIIMYTCITIRVDVTIGFYASYKGRYVYVFYDWKIK